MSYQDGIAAINLERTARIPRTEYSAEGHWPLVSRVTGINVTHDSPPEIRSLASHAFIKAWNYDFIWSIWGDAKNIMRNGPITKMGHAVYADGGVDYIDDRGSGFADAEAVLAFDPRSAYEKLPRSAAIQAFNDAYDANCAGNPDAVNMTGIYVTCVSGLIDMFGWELLLEAAGTDPDGFGEVTNRYNEFIRYYFDCLADSKAPVVMVHDDICWTEGAVFRNEWYRKYIFPNIKKCIDPLRQAGKKIAFTSDGTYSMFVDDIAACGVSGFVMEPTTDMKYIAEKYGKTHFFIGNADTRVLLFGGKEDIYNEVKRCMDIGRDCNGFFLAVGNHIPSNTPVENCLYYNECYEKLSKRK